MSALANKDIAEVFTEISELLTIQGGDPYRARAFLRSARVIENLGEPAETLLHRNALRGIPGIGDGSVHRIKQILRSGTCDDHRRLRSSLPSGLRDILELRGVGPRTVRIIWQHLRISSVEELEAACKAGKLRKLPRMGERTEERILEAIAVWKKRVGRVALHRALKVGGFAVDWVRQCSEALRVELTGSARRRKATVGDLDVLVAADIGGPVVQQFCNMPGVEEILWRGDGRASVRLESRQQVDLRVIPPESWGAGLHYFTGSQLHNIAIRTRGQKKGVRISEHGVFLRPDDAMRLAPGSDEADIFAAVGLPWIPPELRENTGEIEAAEAGRLPRLVDAADLRGDMHLHTVASDGKGTAREMAEAAIRLGLQFLVITDHSKSLEVANGLDERRVVQQGEEIRAVEDALGGRLRLLRGTECDILPDGELDLEPDVLRGLDWVVGSVHSEMDMPPGEMTHRLIKAIESGLVDCIGHPTGRMLGEREGFSFDVEAVLKACLRCGVAMEIDGSPKRMDLDDIHARACREMGVLVCVDTDAHAPEHLPHREYGLAMARRAWLEPKDVLNTQSWEFIADRRKQRLRGNVTTVIVGRPLVEAVPEKKPVATNVVDALADALDGDPLDGEIRARLEKWLMGEIDEEMALAIGKKSDNPLMWAFQRIAMG